MKTPPLRITRRVVARHHSYRTGIVRSEWVYELRDAGDKVLDSSCSYTALKEDYPTAKRALSEVW